MDMATISIVLLCFAALFAFCWAGYRRTKEESARWMEETLAEIETTRIAMELRRQQVDVLTQEYDAKFAGGTRLYLERDGRKELYGSARAMSGDAPAQRHSIRKDVREWCKANLVSEWQMIPFTEKQPREAVLWFEDPNEAMWFKMTWY